MITQARRGRIEDYAELRSWGLTEVQAAVRLGTTTRTAERYEAHLLRQEGAMAASEIEPAGARQRGNREQMRDAVEMAAAANNMELPDSAAYEGAVRLAEFARDAAELADWLEMCGLVPAGMPRPGRPPLGTISLSTGYQRPGVV